MRTVSPIALVACFISCSALGEAQPSPTDGTAVAFYLGRPIGAQAEWNPGGLAGLITYDRSLRPAWSLVLAAGGAAGTSFYGAHSESIRLTQQYLALGLRLTSHEYGRLHAYGWAAAAYFRVEQRLESHYDGQTSTVRDTLRTPGVVIGLGGIAKPSENGRYLVGELTGLLPRDQEPVGATMSPPNQVLATVGIRFEF